MIEVVRKFTDDTAKAIDLLLENELFDHALIQLFSSIDALGLLAAPLSQEFASSNSFKEWAKKYMIDGYDLSINENDLWAARCGLLHTHSSVSNLSKSGRAKELVYFIGDTSSEEFQKNIHAVNILEHASPVKIEGLVMAYCTGVLKFNEGLELLIKGDLAYENRIKDVIKSHF